MRTLPETIQSLTQAAGNHSSGAHNGLYGQSGDDTFVFLPLGEYNTGKATDGGETMIRSLSESATEMFDSVLFCLGIPFDGTINGLLGRIPSMTDSGEGKEAKYFGDGFVASQSDQLVDDFII